MNRRGDFDNRSANRGEKTAKNHKKSAGNKNSSSNFGGDQSARGGGTEKLPVELLQRLASGQKAFVDKKAMRKLTKNNYENLPEVRQRKEDAKRREELAA